MFSMQGSCLSSVVVNIFIANMYYSYNGLIIQQKIGIHIHGASHKAYYLVVLL